MGCNTKFEGTKFFDGKAKLMLSTLWVGPYLRVKVLPARVAAN